MENNNGNKWYIIRGHAGHVGAGKSREVVIYVFAGNIVDALGRYKKISRIKSSKLPNSIETLTESQGKQLEKSIEEEGRVKVDIAKESHYFSPNSHY